MTVTAEQAREAYASGWAISGGPMTTRVKAGCEAAVRLACEHADEPGILEVTLKLGALEGVWASIYARREKLIADHIKLVTAAWRKALTKRMLQNAVRDFRRRIGLTETDSTQDQDGDAYKAAALAAAEAMLTALPKTEAWAEIRLTLRNAIATGYAEGEVGALALAAEQAEKIGIDWDIAFQDAYDKLAQLGTLWSSADGWLAKMLDRATADLGQALATTAQAGAEYDDMLLAAMEALDSEDIDAVAFIVDWALSTGLGQGALALYQREGVTYASWLSAGDSRVCPICEANETGSPYTVTDFPELPAHPRCRCTAAADWSLPDAYDSLLTTA